MGKNLTILTELTAKIDGRLQEFAAIPLREEGSNGYCSDYGAPRLSVYNKTNPDIHKLPNAGKAVVDYRLKRKTVEIREDGTERYSTEIEIDTIEATELEAIVDKYDFDRARDNGGRFAQGVTVSPDEMSDAYLTKKKKVAIGAGLAGAGLATAAVLKRKTIAPALSSSVARMLIR